MFRFSTLSRCLLITGLSLTVWLPRSDAAPAPPPATDFFRPQAISFAQLNPAGTHLAIMVYDEKTDSTGLRIIELGTRKNVLMPGSKTYDVRSFRWAGNERLVFSVTSNNLYAAGLYLIHRDLVKPPSVLCERLPVQVLGVPAARPDNLLVWILPTDPDQPRPGQIVELKLREGADRGFDIDGAGVVKRIDPPAADEVFGVMTDRAGEVRYATCQKQGSLFLSRRETDGRWTRLSFDFDQYRPLAVDAEPGTLLVAKLTPAGSRELVRLNTLDGSVGPVLYRDPKYDFSEAAILTAGPAREIVGLEYHQQGPAQVWLSAENTAAKKSIDGALPPGRTNLIISRSDDDTRLLVRSSSDRHPGTLYLFEPKEAALTPVGDYAPRLARQTLGEVRTMSYRARDGLMLDAYVTLPPGYAPGKPMPMVVLAHGGPWVRDSWGYHAESQFLASRGYLVFQPNYRGSSGYTADVSLAPRMEFLKMHQDVTDGVQALIKSGIADPKHLAIIGGSFGGYLAVCGAAFEPNLYRCAVTIAGVFDWSRMAKEDQRDHPYLYYTLTRSLGDPESRQEKFAAMSPILSVDKIRIPVFIAHGEGDSRVASSQSHRLAVALKKAGVPCETMFETWEGHGFSTLKNRVELYERIEAFLKKHLEALPAHRSASVPSGFRLSWKHGRVSHP